MILKCQDCGLMFAEPVAVLDGFSHAFGTEVYSAPSCPQCGGRDFAEMDTCPRCARHLKEKTAHLCSRCAGELLARIHSFFDTLTAEEEAQFDDWMDGNSITDRKTWR